MGEFRDTSRKFQKTTTKNQENYFGNFENQVTAKKLLRKISRNILGCSSNATEIFENYFENFQKKFLKISRIIS